MHACYGSNVLELLTCPQSHRPLPVPIYPSFAAEPIRIKTSISLKKAADLPDRGVQGVKR